MGDLLDRAQELKARGEPFALLTVVRVERPASATAGMKAIVVGDGTLIGWVGGSCAHPIAVDEALASMREESPRFIRLSPERDSGGGREGVIAHVMTCHSGGSLDIYIEPVLPRPQLILAGEGPIATTLVKLGGSQDFRVVTAGPSDVSDGRGGERFVPLSELKTLVTPTSYVVVATMGSYDEEALEHILGAGAPYVGLVASRKRGEAVFAYLRSRGFTEEQLRSVKVPAGLDLGAVTPEEIALTIMAEIVAVRRKRGAGLKAAIPLPSGSAAEVVGIAEALDPVCGMTVRVTPETHNWVYEGTTFYFCSAHCQKMFGQDPARYAGART